MLNDPRLEVVFTQLEVFWLLLNRPAVQWQIMAITLVIALAWLLDRVVALWIYPRIAPVFRANLEKKRTNRYYSLLRVVKHLFFPLIGLVLIPIAVALFARWQQPAGLIQDAAVIFWIFLLYEIILSLLEIWLANRDLQLARKRILLPFFIVVPVVTLLNQFIDVRSIMSISIFFALDADITLGRLVMAGLWFYGFVVLSWVVVGALQWVILPRTQATTGVVHSVTTITRYLFKIIGVLVVLATLGVDLTSLALIGTALTVGISFGAQQVIANFISGLMLLFEQSLRPGDVIEIDNQLGTVQELNMRSTTIRTVDAEIIVPNETFLTTQVITYTKSSSLMRVAVPIGVSYHSDPQEVRRVLVATARQHELVLDEPEPSVFFDAFGDSSIDFTLVAWINDPTSRRRVQSDLNFMVWEAMAEHGIEIPFPQRDLNLGDGWQAFTQALASRSQEQGATERPSAAETPPNE
jgi:potassium-dependent mechanosensitive channel